MPVLPSFKNQLIDLHSKSIDRFLYEGNSISPEIIRKPTAFWWFQGE